MPNLLTMPNEVLHEIVSVLDQHTVFNLMLANLPLVFHPPCPSHAPPFRSSETHDARAALPDAGANPDARSSKGQPLVVRTARDSRLMDVLRKYGADVNPTDRHGCSAIMVAPGDGCPSVVETLLARNADLSLVDRNRRTLFATACYSHNQRVIDLLAEHDSVDITAEDTVRRAVEGGLNSTLVIFLRRGVLTSHVCDWGGSIVHTAVLHARNQDLRILLDSAVRSELGDRNGLTR